jgi:hypothetical protein
MHTLLDNFVTKSEGCSRSELPGDGHGIAASLGMTITHPSKMEEFFHGSDTQFGIFYPKNYLVAIFEDLPKADEAQRSLLAARFIASEVLAVPGHDIVKHAHENFEKKGLWGAMMAEVSRAIGTEASFADQDLQKAREGAAFLIVHAPTEEKKQAAWKTIAPFKPSVTKHFSNGGIEFMGGTDHTPVDRHE